MLELRPNCELCDVDLPAGSAEARICSYECTFCAACVDGVLANVCPNCGGGFVPRPIRPRGPWRPDTGLGFDPAGVTRRHTSRSDEEIRGITGRLRAIPPADR